MGRVKVRDHRTVTKVPDYEETIVQCPFLDQPTGWEFVCRIDDTEDPDCLHCPHLDFEYMPPCELSDDYDCEECLLFQGWPDKRCYHPDAQY